MSVSLFPNVGIVSDSCLHITTCTYRHLNPNHNYAFAQGNLHHSVTLLLLSRLPSLAGWAFLHHACSWSSVFVALTSPPSLLVNCFLFIISISFFIHLILILLKSCSVTAKHKKILQWIIKNYLFCFNLFQKYFLLTSRSDCIVVQQWPEF